MSELRTPTDLDTVRSFLNTLDLDDGSDGLADGETFSTWLVDAGLVAAGTTVAERELALGRQLREVLRALARANHDGTTDAAASLRLSELAAELAVRVRFTADGGVGFGTDGEGASGALAAIVATTAAAVADDRWRRVKLCGDEDCGWAFYDESRNRSGRWCSMAVCGNRAKARNFRSRQADPSPDDAATG